MIIIEITQDMKRLAIQNRFKNLVGEREYRLSSSKLWVHQYLPKGKLFSNYIGDLGELSFMKYLDENNIRYKTNKWIVDSWEGDSCDIIIDGKLYDVKSGYLKFQLRENCFPNNYNCLINRGQVEKKKVDYFVHTQISMNFDVAYIMGFIEYDSVWEYPITDRAVQDPAFVIPFTHLNPVSVIG